MKMMDTLCMILQHALRLPDYDFHDLEGPRSGVIIERQFQVSGRYIYLVKILNCTYYSKVFLCLPEAPMRKGESLPPGGLYLHSRLNSRAVHVHPDFMSADLELALCKIVSKADAALYPPSK